MQFGRYVLSEHLGTGGYSTVYRAQDGHGRPLAVKVLKDAFLPKGRVRKRFTAEARLLAALDHDGIIRCHGLEREGERVAIVLDFFESRPLGPCSHAEDSFAKTLEVLLQVGMALSYLHARNVVHLDVKPANILVNDRGEAKLIDFFLAFKVSLWNRLIRRFRRGPIPGSPSYMAPEVIAGHVPDQRADLYSLGVVTYFALTGSLPFSGGGTEQILRRQAESTPAAPTKLNPRIPASLELLIFRLLAKDRARRLSSAELFCEELLKIGCLGKAVAAP